MQNTYIIVDFRYGIATEYKGDFNSYGKPLHENIFNHKGLESVRHDGEGYIFKFSNYTDAMIFMQYLDSKGLEVY